MKKKHFLKFFFIILFLQSCSSQIVIKNPEIPQLLIDKSPYDVAVIYPENFDNFIHEEKVIGRKSWKIDFSDSNKTLFNKVCFIRAKYFFESRAIIFLYDTMSV